MSIKTPIDKKISGKENLDSLIEKAVDSSHDILVSYDKNSIQKEQSLGGFTNSSVSVVVKAGANVIEHKAKYQRPDLGLAKPYEPLFWMYVSEIKDENLADILKAKVSDRLSIPTTDFKIQNLNIGTNGTNSTFEIVAYDKAETISEVVQGRINTRLGNFIINDTTSELGINTQKIANKDKFRRFFEPGRTELDHIKNFVLSNIGRHRADYNESGSIDILMSPGISDELKAHTDIFDNNRFVSKLILFKNQDYWEYGGHYLIRGLNPILESPGEFDEYNLDESFDNELEKANYFISPEMVGDQSFPLNPDILSKRYNAYRREGISVVPYKTTYRGGDRFYYLYYPSIDFAQKDLEEYELKAIQDDISLFFSEKMAFPTDCYKIFGAEGVYKMKDASAKNNISHIYIAIKEGSIIEPSGTDNLIRWYDDESEAYWKLIPIIFIFSKGTKCKFLDLFEYVDGHNHIGFLEGSMDGWSIGNIEWWKIDAGYVRDNQGRVITRTDEIRWSGSEGFTWTVKNPPGCAIDDAGNITVNGVTYGPSLREEDTSGMYSPGSFKIAGTDIVCSEWSTYSTGGTSSGSWSFKEEIKIDDDDLQYEIDDKIQWPSSNGQYQHLDLATIVNVKLSGFKLKEKENWIVED